MTMQQALSQSFGPEYSDLSNDRKAALLSDFATMCNDEYDVGDPTMPDCIEAENITEAAIVYRRRIGKGNLVSYTNCLLVSRK